MALLSPSSPSRIGLKEDFWDFWFSNWPLLIIMLKYFQKTLCERSWDISLNNFGPNWAQIVLFLEKMIFWKNWQLLLLSTYFLPLSCNVSKKSLDLGTSWDTRCYSFGPNRTLITHLPIKEILLKNCTIRHETMKHQLRNMWNIHESHVLSQQ